MTVKAVQIYPVVVKKSSIEKMATRSTAFDRLPDEIIEQCVSTDPPPPSHSADNQF
jgi:hypothetical protein